MDREVWLSDVEIGVYNGKDHCRVRLEEEQFSGKLLYSTKAITCNFFCERQKTWLGN